MNYNTNIARHERTGYITLNMTASAKRLGAVLSQKGKDGEVHVIAYASRSLRPSERSMRDYSSAKIELMALKWSVCEKFKDYLLGSKFTVFTDNNPLVYVKTSKLGAAQIRWLSELALYDFDIVYRTGRSNLVADALSRRPDVEGENHNQTGSDNDDEEWQAISYSTICEELEGVLGGVKVGRALKERIQVGYNLLKTTFMVRVKSRSSPAWWTYFIKFHPPPWPSTKQRTIN